MDVGVEVLNEATSEVIEAFSRLLPQLSSTAPPLDAAALSDIVSAPASTMLIARADGKIVGTTTLIIFRIPTGIRAWIEDVVVDEAVRGRGVGEALTREALRIAGQAGAKTVDLTTRPSREAAGRLYERVGFARRDSRLYRFMLS